MKNSNAHIYLPLYIKDRFNSFSRMDNFKLVNWETSICINEVAIKKSESDILQSFNNLKTVNYPQNATIRKII